MIRWLVLLGALVGVIGPAVSPGVGLSDRSQSRPAVTVAAAVSLTEALTRVARDYEAAAGEPVRLTLAASNVVATQVIAGAPVDVVVSANVAQMTRMADARRIVGESRGGLLSNQLVIVARDATIATPADLLGETVGRIALGNPEAVPAGQYAQEYLQSLGMWDALRDKVVPTRSVRAALAAVESGHATAALVYRTDAVAARRALIVHAVPLDEGPAITYEVALVRGGPNGAGGRRFLAYLRGVAGEVFEELGFIVLARPSADLAPAAQAPGWSSHAG